MAILRQDYKAGGTGSPPPGVAYNNPCSIGDVLVATIQVSSGGNPGATTVSDTINSGNWTLLNFQLDLTNSLSWLGTYFKVANAAGTPTVSCSQTSNQFGQLIIARYNGFVGTPTADAGITAVANGTGTAVSCSPITTNYTNELLLVTQVSGTFTTSTITGWTAMNGNTFGSPFYQSIETSSGATDNFAGTLGSSGGWAVVAAGIGDASASGVSVAWWV
jgi:hypothetical protein